MKFKLHQESMSLADHTQVYYIDGFYHEPTPFIIRKVLEDRLWIKRRLMLSYDLPTFAASKEFPQQVFFYGIPEAYAKRALTHGWKENPEKIAGVTAMDHVSGILWYARAPMRHHHLMQFMWEYGVSALDRQEAEQGFMNGIGQMLDREEALKRAIATRQLKEYYSDGTPKHSHYRELFSEDLW